MYNIVELFSGIGSQARALQNIGIETNVLGTCEWDIHASVAYDAIHNMESIPSNIAKMTKDDLLEKLKKFTLSNNGKEAMKFSTLKAYPLEILRHVYASIINSNNFVDVSSLTGEAMPKNIDILTYSFPCQDLSNVGAFHGYNKGIDKGSGSRSSLLWQVGRILQEMKDEHKRLPRYLLMENVPSLLSERHLKNFTIWIKDLEDLGYVSKYFRLNAYDFGLPQNRPRLLMISVWVGQSDQRRRKVKEYFESKDSKEIVADYKKSGFFHKKEIKDLLRINYNEKKYLKEANECNPNNTSSRRKIWDENPQLVLKGNVINPNFHMVRTITTKQDRNPNSGNLYFAPSEKGRSSFRYLTPRECLLFMGFTDGDYENIIKKNDCLDGNRVLFPRDKIIRLAGNSIPVRLLEGIFYQIKQIDEQIIRKEMI